MKRRLEKGKVEKQVHGFSDLVLNYAKNVLKIEMWNELFDS